MRMAVAKRSTESDLLASLRTDQPFDKSSEFPGAANVTRGILREARMRLVSIYYRGSRCSTSTSRIMHADDMDRSTHSVDVGSDLGPHFFSS